MVVWVESSSSESSPGLRDTGGDIGGGGTGRTITLGQHCAFVIRQK